jgi:signal transduction histidine kinase
VNERFTEMLGVLAHEMRTPLSAILGYQELLADGILGSVDERGQEPLSRIAYSAKQLLHLIDGVQEVMSPPQKQLEVHPQVFDPGTVLRECIANANVDAHGRNIRLAETLDPDLPQLNGDPDRFCRAIDLALSAAIKTSHGATLDVGARDTNGNVEIAIAGTALQPGRDDPELSYLMNGESEKLTGAGLRLAIVRHLAQQMNGDIKLVRDSANTTLLLQLPAHPG